MWMQGLLFLLYLGNSRIIYHNYHFKSAINDDGLSKLFKLSDLYLISISFTFLINLYIISFAPTKNPPSME